MYKNLKYSNVISLKKKVADHINNIQKLKSEIQTYQDLKIIMRKWSNL